MLGIEKFRDNRFNSARSSIQLPLTVELPQDDLYVEQHVERDIDCLSRRFGGLKMMKQRQTRLSQPHAAFRTRGGYSLIELLVSIAIISLLIALIAPAIQQARAAARRTQCLNNTRNISLAVYNLTDSKDRFPACGYFAQAVGQRSWVVDLLPWIDQSVVYDQWDLEKSSADPGNQAVAQRHLSLLTCPDDISVTGGGDLSYVVSGGVGFTVRWSNGTHDCPVDPAYTQLDLNGNGVVSSTPPPADGTPSDKDYFLAMGLFFNETWKWNVTVRHHRFASVLDGLSQTIMLSENVRTGADPASPSANWASNSPYLTSFYIGNPCANSRCDPGNVDYQRSNTGQSAINSGLTSPEGSSPYPNSFHSGGVNVAFCDGHVKFISQNIDGGVYAALVSPQGQRLSDALRQVMVGEGY